MSGVTAIALLFPIDWPEPFGLVMMDLDGFKAVNDNYGHETGDDVLRQLAESLHNHLRSTDFLARYGGDEMTLVLPDTDLTQAAFVARKLQNHLRSLNIPLPDGQTITIGVFGGIVSDDDSGGVLNRDGLVRTHG